MEYFPAIFHGLMSTLFISMISILIAIIPGSLIFFGKRSQSKILFWICTVYIEVFKGIPLLAQLFFIFYALPLISRNLTFSTTGTAIIVLTLNAIANIAGLSHVKSDSLKTPLNLTSKFKVIILSLILEFGRLVKYSALLSVIGFTDLLRTALTIMNSTTEVKVLIIVLVIYLSISVLIRLIHTVLEKSFFTREIEQA